MKVCFMRVPKSDAARSIGMARESAIIDDRYRIESDSKYVYIPVKKKGSDTVMRDVPMEKNPLQRIGKILKAKHIKQIPSSFIRLGNSIIFKECKNCKSAARIYAKELKVDNVYADTGKINGNMRKPSLKLLYGRGNDTLITENGTKYSLNLLKLMFSPGNFKTRTKMGTLDLANKTVIDMFCGIGYFSLPLLKYVKVKSEILSDINPDSIDYLKKNISINKINTPIKILNGDCRVCIPYQRVDYIIMGNFESIHYLSAALIRSMEGTIISMHYLSDEDGIENKIGWIISLARRMGYIMNPVATFRVKSMAPHYLHMNTQFEIISIK
ncbi:MAG: methyltransferase [Ferroplasma sp.]